MSSPACAQAVTIKATNVQETIQTQVVGSVTGSLIDLPAGALQFNVGAEYRKNTGGVPPGPVPLERRRGGFQRPAADLG